MVKETQQNDILKKARDLGRATVLLSHDSSLNIVVNSLKKKVQSVSDKYAKLAKLVASSGFVNFEIESIFENYFIVETTINEISNLIKKKDIKKFPLVNLRRQIKTLRLYSLFENFLTETSNKVEKQTLLDFLSEYQKESPLSIRELNAVPLILRLILVENFGTIIDAAKQEVAEFQEADEAYLIIRKRMSVSTNPSWVISMLASKYPLIPINFGIHLRERLLQEGSIMRPITKWIRLNLEKQGMWLDKISEVRENVRDRRALLISNIIESLHWLNQVRWDSIAESINVVDNILFKDPAGVFPFMEMESRDMYRNVIVNLSEGVSVSEAEVAKSALKLALKSKGFARHVGYFLIDPVGRNILEKEIKYQPKKREIFYNNILSNPQTFYFTLLAILVFVSIPIFFRLPGIQSNPLLLLVWFIISIFFALEAGLVILNTILTQLLPVRRLPRIKLLDDVGENNRTFVVVPSMLRSEESIRNIIKKLEVRFLGNKQKNIYYALLFDFKDAEEEKKESDEILLNCLDKEINRLNIEYGNGEIRFFGLTRKRLWNPKEGVFMGWERKRGKLREFNELLRDKETSYIDNKNINDVGHVRFVITLDEDTQLPHDTARKLIGTMAHPLNAPVLNDRGEVVRGYGVIQPRVAVRLAVAARSLYSKLYSSGSGIDSYSGPVSDVYQDLFGSAIFFGKGIYDIDAIENSMSNKIPDNTVLSHDLLEGIYARTGFAGDVVLFDGFPDFFHEFIIRLERWVRGDWQIIGWLFARQSDFLAIDKFKIFDNLRRSILPVIISISLFLSFLQNRFIYLMVGVVVMLALSQIFSLMVSIVRLYNIPLRVYFKKLFKDFAIAFIQTTLKLIFLVQHAWVSFIAVSVTFFRLFVSQKNLLKWKSSHDVSVNSSTNIIEYYKLFLVSVLLSLFSLIYLFVNGQIFNIFSIFLVLWISAPIVAVLISKKNRGKQDLNNKEINFVRALSYRTFLFFLENANKNNNFLVPDHVQEYPLLSGEYRTTTSPTNIGMQVTSLIGAFELGFISPNLYANLNKKLFESLSKLPRINGHFMNWYDIGLLEPINPQYVSSVDSANFLMTLVAAKQAYKEFPSKNIVDINSVKSLCDAMSIFIEDISKLEHTVSRALRKNLREIISSSKNLLVNTRNWKGSSYQDFKEIFNIFYNHVEKSYNKISAISAHDPLSLSKGILDSVERVFNLVKDKKNSLNELVSFDDNLVLDTEKIPENIGHLVKKIKMEVFKISTMYDLTKKIEKIENLGFENEIKKSEISIELKEYLLAWYKKVLLSVQTGANKAREMMEIFNNLQKDCERYINEADFKFLYNKEKELFHIGYNVAFKKVDNACYNFMASEATSVSFMAILKGEASQKHWFYLGRKLVRSGGLISLISWGGSLFEYLTSLIFFDVHDDSLMGSTASAAIKVHMKEGREYHTPWGMGESAFSQFDTNKHYQYQIFGSPKLGLKRNLSEYLVLAPYTTALSMNFFPKNSIRNLRALIKKGATGVYGYYDALDYGKTKKRLKKPLATKVYYAHHQGFAFASYVNVLLKNKIKNLFHSDPSVQALEVLFEEKLPDAPIAEELSKPIQISFSPKIHTKDTGFESKRFISNRLQSLQHSFISNGLYSVRVGSDGSSTSFYKGIALSRPNIDPQNSKQGMFFYCLNKKNKHQFPIVPQLTEHQRKFKTVFYENKVEFIGSHNSLETVLSISVEKNSPVEVRECVFNNTGKSNLNLDLTLYSEMSLAYPQKVFHHQHYEHLLVKSEILPKDIGTLFYKQNPLDKNKNIFCAQLLVSKKINKKKVELFTSREEVLKRFHDLPVLPDNPDHNKRNIPLDPASSIFTNIEIEAGEMVSVMWVQIVAESREELERLIKKYKNAGRAHNVISKSIVESAISTQARGISQEQTVLFQEIASQVLNGVMRSNYTSQNSEPIVHCLWRLGISGDYPIVLFSIHDIKDMQTVKQAIMCFEYFQSKNIVVDIVILNNQPASYVKILDDEIDFMLRQANANSSKESGTIFQVKSDLISQNDRAILISTARFFMDSKDETLREAIQRIYRERKLEKTQKFLPTRPHLRLGSRASLISTPSLSFYNSWGGFDKQTNEYILTISSNRMPPNVWSHIIAQENFGTIVCDSGSSYTWSQDSYDNRLTDRKSDSRRYQSSEIIYLRDDETGEIWSPTPFPVETKQEFLVRYGFGYATYESKISGLEQKLTVFIPKDETLKISLLELNNRTNRDRNLSLYYYLEPSMSIIKDHTRDYLNFDFDQVNKTFYFENKFRNQMPGRSGFASFGDGVLNDNFSWTTDKREFIGRNGSYSFPSALRKNALSNKILNGSESCLVISKKINIPAGTSVVVPLLLGESANKEEAKIKAQIWQGQNYDNALKEVIDSWNKKLNKVKVETGNLSIDILMNGWLLYQLISSRLYAKTGFYQPSGAYGFRDQLQDVSALTWADPKFTKSFLEKAAEHQFKEGDALNWWHDHNNFGIRTVLSDHQLWLTYTLFEYVKFTGDKSLLDVEKNFLEAPLLSFNEKKQWTGVPNVSSEKATIFEHAMRAIEKSLVYGKHGLPLIGLGDWNDGLSEVGSEGKGESVWTAWFLIRLLKIALPYLEERNETERLEKFKTTILSIEQAIKKFAWDGKWYRRAYFDNGTALGSRSLKEFKIDSLAQSWSVISGAGDREKSVTAHKSMLKLLYKENYFALIYPALRDGLVRPGYIQEYPAGIRENGAQYNHAILWAVQSYLALGENETAEKIFELANPIVRTSTVEKVKEYMIEPYVLASDIYGGSLAGRGGWSWYTGSAGVMYRTILENIFGIERKGERLSVNPHLFKEMNDVKINLSNGNSTYNLNIKKITNSNRSEIISATIDGLDCDAKNIPFANDGGIHEIIVNVS